MDLILWRHAEALDMREVQDDLDRALTPKGERQALRMAEWLNRHLPASTRVLVSPARYWPAAFVAMFGIPLMLAGNAVLLAVALWRRWHKNWAWVALLGLLSGYPFVHATVPRFWQGDVPAGTPTLKVLSYNTENFMAFTRHLEPRKANAKAMLGWFKREAPDLLVLQEVWQYPAVSEFMVLEQLPALGYPHYYWSGKAQMPDGAYGPGMLIASRHELRNGATLFRRKGSHNKILRVDMDWQGRTVRVINVHLQSIRLTYTDLSLRYDDKPFKTKPQRIVDKMRKAFIRRAAQVSVLLEAIRTSPHPVLICGDFNDTPYSYTYWQLRRYLQNSHEQAGSGLGTTYIGKIKRTLRIDHQFADGRLRCHRLAVVDTMRRSAHLPLMGTYSWARP